MKVLFLVNYYAALLMRNTKKEGKIKREKEVQRKKPRQRHPIENFLNFHLKKVCVCVFLTNRFFRLKRSKVVKLFETFNEMIDFVELRAFTGLHGNIIFLEAISVTSVLYVEMTKKNVD